VADQVSFGPNTKGAGSAAPVEGEEKDDLPF
jgi:hypothetical protein